LRWTVKTASGTKDLDTSFPLLLNHFYHVAVVYSGYSMELYLDGLVDSFLADSGLMLTTSKAIAFGKKDVGISNYYLRGTLDEVRMYDKALAPDEIFLLQSIWNTDSTTTGIRVELGHALSVYPNPSNYTLLVKGLEQAVTNVELFDQTGRRTDASFFYNENDHILTVEVDHSTRGLLILKIETGREVVYKKVVIGQ
jgi:hypothetical protein